MQIKILAIGKTDQTQIQQLTDMYLQRLKHYIKIDFEILPDIKNSKNLQQEVQKTKEGELILQKIQPSDILILLDEKGNSYSSIDFADFLQKKMNSGIKNLIFAIGGPYGFSEAIYHRANGKLSLSAMTFSHQMIRLFFIEQIYRAFSILNNEPYHHQ